MIGRKKPPIETGRRQRPTTAMPSTNYSYHSRRATTSEPGGRHPAGHSLASAPRVRFRSGFAVAGLMVAVFALIALTRLSVQPRIVVLGSTQGTALQAVGVYKSAAQQYLSSSLLNRSKITVNTEGLSHALQQRFPELALVTVTLPVINTQPVMYIQAAQPALILNSTSGSYVIDERGQAVVTSASLSTSNVSKLVAVTDQSGLAVKPGTLVLPASDVQFIKTVALELRNRGIRAETYTLPAATRELDVKIAGSSYFVKFNVQSGTAREQAGTFLALKHHLESEHISPGSYIDVRVDGRAYYK